MKVVVSQAAEADLETIAEHAKSLFAPVEPSDALWNKIQDKLKQQPADDDVR